MKIEEFRITEIGGLYYVERLVEKQFTDYGPWYTLFWPTFKVKKVWTFIDDMGYELNIHNYKYALEGFNTKKSAISKIKELCEPEKHYYPPTFE